MERRWKGNGKDMERTCRGKEKVMERKRKGHGRKEMDRKEHRKWKGTGSVIVFIQTLLAMNLELQNTNIPLPFHILSISFPFSFVYILCFLNISLIKY